MDGIIKYTEVSLGEFAGRTMNTMTKITKETFFTAGQDWSPEEVQTAAEEYNKIKDTLERVSEAKRDTVVLAGAVTRILDKHGRNSPLYRDFVSSIITNAPGWHDENFRKRAIAAYRGYEAMPGSDADKEFIWKLKPSLSALTECQNIHPSQQFDFRKVLKTGVKFPTQKQIEAFAQGRKLTSKTTTPYIAPEQPVAASAPVIEPEPYVVSEQPSEVSCNQAEPINITAQVVVVENPQQVLINQLIECYQKLNLDELFVNKEQLEQLKPYLSQMETLYEMAKQPRTTQKHYV